MAGPMADVRAAFRQIGAVLLFRQRGMLIEQTGICDQFEPGCDRTRKHRIKPFHNFNKLPWTSLACR
jgi:hypothetical protein